MIWPVRTSEPEVRCPKDRNKRRQGILSAGYGSADAVKPHGRKANK